MTKSNLNTVGLTARVWSIPGLPHRRQLRQPTPAPSVRLPATRENRERLRALRQTESAAWKTANPTAALRAEVQRALTARRAESRLVALLAVLATGALTLGLTSSFAFVTHWDRFVSLVRTLVG